MRIDDNMRKRLIAALFCCFIVPAWYMTGCSAPKQETETTATIYNEADLMAMYGLIHEAIPTAGNIGEYSVELIETDMYINLYVYNSERSEADDSFEELTMDEIRDYLSNGEITVDYLNANWELLYLVKCEYGMSDRVKDYFEWYWGDGAYATDENSDHGSQKIESFRVQLQSMINDLREENPGQIAIGSVHEMDIEQITVLIGCDGDISTISEEDLELFR